MKRATTVLIVAYLILFVWAWFDTHSLAPEDGRGLMLQFVLIFAAITAAFLVPATLLTWKDRAPKTALTLALCPAALFTLATVATVL
ncbi:hypothetical protein [Shimia sagamensis]|uniref:Uncharacterized protein n=1 Tax=Shimia sagamensis TaxID=1566352 RepID=A0ABY1P2M7_9RHOB|nr:hypothetical protein [Shimia sagamensis]SMP24990.1 hypothetical protein SAMN06265373_10534 [Shimia sagamensis]